MLQRTKQLAATVMLLVLLTGCGSATPGTTPGTSTTTSPPAASADTPASSPAAAATTPETDTAAAATAPTDATGTVATGAGEQINAVATTSILADLVQNVGGERVNVDVLLPPGTDPHSYSPTPSDVQTIAQSQIVFENGLGLEEWMDELIANAGGSRPTVTVTEGITPLEGEEHSDEHGEEATAAAGEHSDDHDDEAAVEAGDDHGEDPHMWLDVQNVIRYVEHIRNGLNEVDPNGAEIYDANAAAYIEQLEQLDQEIAAQLQTVPAERRKLITNHDTFGYFAQRYGFEVVGTVFEGVSTEQEPSAQQIAQLVRQVQEQNVPAIFTENTVNPRLAEQVADEAGVQVVTNLYTDALGEPGSEGDTYIKMMRHNVQQIVEALSR